MQNILENYFNWIFQNDATIEFIFDVQQSYRALELYCFAEYF